MSDDTTISARTLVTAVGSAPNRLLDSMSFARADRGRLVVDETLSVPEDPRIWAVGDCAAVPDLRSGGTCPPTAQFALRQARHVARNILATVNRRTPRPFSYRSLGIFVPLGRFSAAAEVLGIKVSGFLAWWLFRTYYLYQLPRLKRKLQVMTDWTLSLFFRRDIVQMNVTRSEGISRAHYEPGQTIFQQGDLARNFYIILSGNVQVVRDHSGQNLEVATLGSGEYFGEVSLLQGVRHTASVRALTPVDLLIMNGADFSALATSSTRFGELLHGAIRQRLHESDTPEMSVERDEANRIDQNSPQ